MAGCNLEIDPEDERLVAVVRHMHARGLHMREIVSELKAMNVVDARRRAVPLSVVWGIVRGARA